MPIHSPGMNSHPGDTLRTAGLVTGESSPTSRVVRGRSVRRDDASLLQVISQIPLGGGCAQTVLIGILNEHGDLYREVRLHTTLEVLHLAARLNVVGLRLAKGQAGHRFPHLQHVFE